jgi:type II secretory pathway component GspD/PulD (secretin)
MRTPLAALLLSFLALQDADRGEAAAPRAGREGSDAPRRPSLVRVQGGQVTVQAGATLSDLLDTLSPLVKRAVVVKKEVGPKLAQTQINSSVPITVPADRAEELLESLLFAHDLVFIEPRSPGMPWGLADLKGQDRMAIRNSALAIEPSQIEALAGRYVLVTVVLPIQHTNAREISASLRPFFPDNQLETVVNVGNANSLLVTGFGPTVSSIARLMRQIDVEQPKLPQEPTLVETVKQLTARIDALEKKLGEKPEREEKPKR